MWLGDRHCSDMCCRTSLQTPVFEEKVTITVTPLSGVTARRVSRRITRSFDNRARIWRGTESSAASDFILLLS